MRTLTKIFIVSIIMGITFLMSNCSDGNAPGKGEESKTGSVKIPGPKIPFSPKHYVCYKTPEPITIDGKITEGSWEKAPWTDYFVDIEGELKPKPRLNTRARMLWDDEYLYISAELEEPEIWATLRQRDTVIFYDNDFEVFIDPDGDTHNYYEFEMNAYGTEWDLMLDKPYRDGGPAISGWDINGMKVGVEIYGTINDPSGKDEKWTLEIAMPWNILKECAGANYPLKAGDQWRINFSRVEWITDIVDGRYVKRKDPGTNKPLPENNWVWSPQGAINMHMPEMWGFLQFSEKYVGEGIDEFIYNKDEEKKWALRQLYYLQKTYKNKNGYFANSLQELGANQKIFNELPGTPEIWVTKSMYEIAIPGFEEGTTWHINHEGRTWKE